MLLASSTVFSQGLIGPKVGLNINSINYVKYQSQAADVFYNPNFVIESQSQVADLSSSKTLNPSVGIVLNVQIGEYFAIRPELLWVQRGGYREDLTYSGFFGTPIVTGHETAKITMNYVEIPLNLVGRYPVGPGKIELFAGFAAGHNLGGTYKTPSKNQKILTGYEPSPTTSWIYTDEQDRFYFNSFNMSLNFGLGYNLKGLIFQAGYNMGLSNMTARPADKKYNTLRNNNVLRSSAITFGVAYLFGGKED